MPTIMMAPTKLAMLNVSPVTCNATSTPASEAAATSSTASVSAHEWNDASSTSVTARAAPSITTATRPAADRRLLLGIQPAELDRHPGTGHELADPLLDLAHRGAQIALRQPRGR